jgi:hypothetical protein
LNEWCAAIVYQACTLFLHSLAYINLLLSSSGQIIVSSILFRPHATDSEATKLSSTSAIRSQVEEPRMDILRWLRKRWVGLRQEGGFNAFQGWAVKEISGGAFDLLFFFLVY